MKLLLMLAAALVAVPAIAQDAVSVRSAVFLETAGGEAAGSIRSVTPASSLQRGDKVVLLMHWRAHEPTGFTITSEVPRHLSFRESARQIEEVSVDGGK